MTEVIYRTPTTNTLAERRVQAITEGRRLCAAPVASAMVHAPAIEAVGVSDLRLSGRVGIIDDPGLVGGMPSPVLQSPVGVRAMMSGLDAPLAGLNGMSLREAISKNQLSMEGNSLPPNWKNLWDALRVDLTIRKLMRPTIRELLYMVADTPNATRTMNITEMFPHAAIFEENNGSGQSVRQMELMAGQFDVAIQRIYAAALTVDLLAVLFGNNFTDLSVNDAVAIGEAALKDELAMAPIFAFSYVAAAQTPANVTAGATREELLYKTLEDGVDGLAKRVDPITDREIGGDGLVLVAGPTDARHCARVVGGGFAASPGIGGYLSLDSISKIVGYEPETIRSETETKTYTPVPTGLAYLVKPNVNMSIAIKRRLQLNVNMNPAPSTLAQEEKAWWFCEAIRNAGIATHVQEITLPPW